MIRVCNLFPLTRNQEDIIAFLETGNDMIKKPELSDLLDRQQQCIITQYALCVFIVSVLCFP
jgi:hypothetical protein